MRVYVMCDQEGTAGMVHFENRQDNDAWNAMYRRRIQELQTAEVKAGCEGLLAAGATDIIICDAHGSGTNIQRRNSFQLFIFCGICAVCLIKIISSQKSGESKSAKLIGIGMIKY